MVFKLTLVNCLQIYLIVSYIQGTCFSHSIQKRDDGDCPPVELENGKFDVLGKNYTAGDPIPKYSIVVFSCDADYALHPDTSLVSCVYGTWNTPVPQCISTCPARHSSSVDVTCTLEGKAVNCSQPLVERTVAVSKCKQFYTPAHNDTSTSTCSKGSWDNDLVECELECGEIASDGATLIVNAQNAKKGEFPWHVGLYRLKKTEYDYYGGGSIISQLIVLAAAHCFTDASGTTRYPAQEYYVAAGKYYSDYNSDADVYAQKRQIKEYHLAPQYEGYISYFVGDLAVLVLKQPFEMTNLVRPVCVDWYNEFESEQLRDNNVGSVVGWGFIDPDNPQISNELQQLNVPFINLTECARSVPKGFLRWVGPEKICAGFTNGSSVCKGDSAGGLVFERKINNKHKFYIRGLVSIGPLRKGLCDNFQYGIYTKISYYRNFILKVLQRNQIRKNNSCPAVTIENGAYKVFKNYYEKGSPIPNNAIVQFACNSNYTLYPEDNSLLSCTDGFWNIPVPQCKLDENIEQSPCPPISIEKGQIFVTGQSYTPDTPIPAYAVVEFNCAVNYSLYPANPLVTCINGKWNAAIPQCKLTCPPLKDSTVDVTCTLDGDPVDCNQPMVEGTVAVSKCKPFYTTTYFEIPVTTCTGTTWDNPLVRCAPDCGELIPDGVTNIINGQNVTKGEFPWHIALYRLLEENHEYQCGGSIISPLIVLTAAHCLTDAFGTTRYPAQEFYIGAGKYYSDYNSEADIYVQKRHVKEYHIPTEFTGHETNYAGDLAVVVVANPFEMTNLVQPVCMDWFNQFESKQLVHSNTGQVVGWGFIDPNIPVASEKLKLLNVPYINKTKCINEYPSNFRRWVTTDKFCAGVRNGSSVCKGDSGGGLVFKWHTQKYYLRGLVSVGPKEKGTCNNFQYGVYTRISNYMDFILNIRRLNQVID